MNPRPFKMHHPFFLRKICRKSLFVNSTHYPEITAGIGNRTQSPTCVPCDARKLRTINPREQTTCWQPLLSGLWTDGYRSAPSGRHTSFVYNPSKNMKHWESCRLCRESAIRRTWHFWVWVSLYGIHVAYTSCSWQHKKVADWTNCICSCCAHLERDHTIRKVVYWPFSIAGEWGIETRLSRGSFVLFLG